MQRIGPSLPIRLGESPPLQACTDVVSVNVVGLVVAIALVIVLVLASGLVPAVAAVVVAPRGHVNSIPCLEIMMFVFAHAENTFMALAFVALATARSVACDTTGGSHKRCHLVVAA